MNNRFNIRLTRVTDAMAELEAQDRANIHASVAPTLSESIVSNASAPQETGSTIGLFVSWGMGIVVLAGLLAFILHFSDVSVFVDTLRAADPLWLAAAFACQLATYLCAASVWSRALARAGTPTRISSLLGLALVELFANQAVPTGGFSGSLMVVRGLMHRGVAPAVAVTALLVAALSYYAAYVLVADVAFILLWYTGDSSNAWASLFVVFIAVVAMLAGALLALMRSRGRFIPTIALQWRPMARLAEMLKQVRMDVLKSGHLIFEAVALQSTLFLLDAATLWCAARSIGMTIDPARIFISFVLASVVATLSPIPMGLGTFEGTCTGMLHFLGSSVETSLAATLILRGLTVWLPMLPGLWMIRREAKRSGQHSCPSASQEGNGQ
jgi:uncharacterized membrane protein YbhN (UPF0104 family)